MDTRQMHINLPEILAGVEECKAMLKQLLQRK